MLKIWCYCKFRKFLIVRILNNGIISNCLMDEKVDCVLISNLYVIYDVFNVLDKVDMNLSNG